MYYTYLSILVFTCRPSLHIHTPPLLLQVELEKDGRELVDMLWCQGAQNIGLSNQLDSTLFWATYDHNAGQSQTDRRTDTPTDIME